MIETLEHWNDPIEPDRSTWCTPQPLARKLGAWDLDPCSNDRSHIEALRTFDFDRRGQDGLKLARFVSRRWRVFINPPYARGQVPLWVEAYAHVRFCYLLRFDPSTDWFSSLIARCELVCLLRDRINFEPPPGVEDPPGSPFPHALFYRRASDATPAILAASHLVQPLHSIEGICHGQA